MRIDTPTLQCDRCKYTTQDLQEMGKFHKITENTMSGIYQWDLCFDCYRRFINFITLNRN